MHRPHTAAQLVLLVTAAVFIYYIDRGNLATVLLPAAGPSATGRWVGVQNAAGNIAGLIAPVSTGILVDRTGLFDVAFGLAAAVNVLGLIGWVFGLPKMEPLRWRST